MSATLLLVRHGQIQANVDEVWHGSTDSELTETGHSQAAAVGKHLAARHGHSAALYTSPLRRTQQTAQAIAAATGLEPRIEPGLREYGIGELEGESYRDLFTEHRFFERMHADADFAPPGGESLRQVVERVIGALTRISSAHPASEVIVVGHGAALGLAFAQLTEGDTSAWRGLHVANCSVSRLVLEPAPKLLSISETDHLPG